MKTKLAVPALACVAMALPASAAMPECMEEAHQLQQALVQHPPIDPRVMNDVLALRHEGLGLCQQGAGAKGRGKLQQALTLATPPGLGGAALPGAPSTIPSEGTGRRP